MVLYYLIPTKNRLFLTITAILAAILLNGIFSYFNEILALPVFMDSIFTIMTAALFGLWPSIAVALLTNIFIELLNGFPGIYLPFIIVNLVTALATSLFVHKKLFETPTHAFWLIIVLSLANSLCGAVIVTLLFGGFTNLSLDNIVRGIIVAGQSLFTSAFIVRLVVNVVDKGFAVLLTFLIYKSIKKKTKRLI